MAVDVSKHLVDALKDEKITAHERPFGFFQSFLNRFKAILCFSLQSPWGPLRCLILCLISDILHNSGSIYKPGAAVYRNEFETSLPAAFERFHSLFKGAKELKLVKRVLSSWCERAIFTPRFIQGHLDSKLLHKPILYLFYTFMENVFFKFHKVFRFSLDMCCKVGGLHDERSLRRLRRPTLGPSPGEARGVASAALQPVGDTWRCAQGVGVYHHNDYLILHVQ